MIRKLVAVTCVAFSLTAIVGTSFAASENNGQGKPVIGCSDNGRSCSVDRNCCSGSCVHGTCK